MKGAIFAVLFILVQMFLWVFGFIPFEDALLFIVSMGFMEIIILKAQKEYPHYYEK